MKKILPLIAALFLALAFIGCNNNVSVGLAGGTYTASQVNGGTTLTMTFTFDSNGTFSSSYTSGSSTSNVTGTYTVNGNSATMTPTSMSGGTDIVITTTDGWQHFTSSSMGNLTFTRQ
ncbi:MAG: hypothetical protein II716_00635 [Treponema sp.]|nr:hypothetical protein [Treponema sp.]